MRKFISTIVTLFFAINMMASDQVTVTISDGIENAAIKAKMERQMSALLTEAGAAGEEHRELNYAALDLSSSMESDLSTLWENTPFMCMDTEVVEHCITSKSNNGGYQIRNIPLMLLDVAEDESYQEAVFNFDKQGNMTRFNFAISQQLFLNVIRSNNKLTDIRRRELILDFVEQFRTAYNKKDLLFLDNVFSDDALIITGKVIEHTKDGIRMPDEIQYKQQTKKEYLTNLRGVFNRNKYIHVTFDDIEVMLHPVDADVYGVTLHQGYTAGIGPNNSKNYHDDGYLFLLWDFKDEEKPKIHVRTWQPDVYDTTTKSNTRLPKNKVYSLADFDI